MSDLLIGPVLAVFRDRFLEKCPALFRAFQIPGGSIRELLFKGRR